MAGMITRKTILPETRADSADGLATGSKTSTTGLAPRDPNCRFSGLQGVGFLPKFTIEEPEPKGTAVIFSSFHSPGRKTEALLM